MCKRCAVMEEAFDTTRQQTGIFSVALAAAMAAGQAYEDQEAQGTVTDEDHARNEAQRALLERVDELGVDGVVSSYATQFASTLGGEHVILVDRAFDLLEATVQTFEKYGQDKVRTTLEVGNVLTALSVMTSSTKFLIIFAALLTELAASPEARAALVQARETIPGVSA